MAAAGVPSTVAAAPRKARPGLCVAVPVSSQRTGDNLAYQDDTQGDLDHEIEQVH